MSEQQGVTGPILAALISNVAIPELLRWLANRKNPNTLITEAEALEKLNMNADAGIKNGTEWLNAHKPMG